MTSTTKEELELFIDTISDNASTLDDYLTEEEDARENEDDISAQKPLQYNITRLKGAIAKLNQVKAIIQDLIDRN